MHTRDKYSAVKGSKKGGKKSKLKQKIMQIDNFFFCDCDENV